MNHEVNDKASVAAESQESKINLVSVHDHDGDKPAVTGVEAMHKMLESNEVEIAAARERIAEIAKRAAAFRSCCEPGHFEAMKDCITRGAAAGEPAYVEMAKHLGC